MAKRPKLEYDKPKASSGSSAQNTKKTPSTFSGTRYSNLKQDMRSFILETLMGSPGESIHASEMTKRCFSAGYDRTNQDSVSTCMAELKRNERDIHRVKRGTYVYSPLIAGNSTNVPDTKPVASVSTETEKTIPTAKTVDEHISDLHHIGYTSDGVDLYMSANDGTVYQILMEQVTTE